jgi:signal transduction histidine kinase
VVNIGLILLRDEMMVATQQANPSELTGVVGKSLLSWIDLIRDVEESSDTAVVVLNDLINYDRLAMENMKLELHYVRVNTLLSNIVRPFHVQATQKNVTLTVEDETDTAIPFFGTDTGWAGCIIFMFCFVITVASLHYVVVHLFI